MKVYKKRHLKFDFNIDSEWVFKAGPREGEIYNGPIIIYRQRYFAGEIMSAEIEKKWEIIPRPSIDKMNEASGTTDKEHKIYDKLKKKYAKGFTFPKPWTHILTDEHREKGEYTRYFVEFKGEVTEVSEGNFDYYKSPSTGYHPGVKFVSVDMKLDVMETDINQVAIMDAARIIPGIVEFINAHDYMQPKQFLYSQGGQLQWEDGTNFIGEYHIHPEMGPMEGSVHVSTKHAQLYWSESQNYRPKDLV